MIDGPQIINVILLIGSAQGLVLSAVLLGGKRGNVYANRILGLNVLSFSLIISLFFLRPDNAGVFCFSCLIVQILFFLLGPLIYFYVRSLTQISFRLSLSSISHLIIFVISALSYFFYFLFFTDVQHSFTDRINAFSRVAPVCSRILAFYMLGYLIYCFFLLKEHNKHIRETHSFQEKINLRWLWFILGGYAVIWLSAIYYDLLGSGCGYNGLSFLSILLSIFMYVMGYMGLRQPEIFTGRQLLNSVEPETLTDNEKYKKSAISPMILKTYAQRLDKVMTEQEPFLKNDLTLAGLASLESLTTHHLSQVINDYYKQNFSEYINGKKIEAAKQLLISPQYKHQNIAVICYEAGFNSVSAFNAAFKKFTGTTPSKYRDQHLV